jgi:hypothetical protein
MAPWGVGSQGSPAEMADDSGCPVSGSRIGDLDLARTACSSPSVNKVRRVLLRAPNCGIVFSDLAQDTFEHESISGFNTELEFQRQRRAQEAILKTSTSWLRINLNVASVFPYDPLDRIDSQACAGAHSLCREKRLKNMGHYSCEIPGPLSPISKTSTGVACTMGLNTSSIPPRTLRQSHNKCRFWYAPGSFSFTSRSC